MTLAQLQSFVLVAQLGSVKAAAAALEVTEPAVSVAVSALRKELGDELFVWDGKAMAPTSLAEQAMPQVMHQTSTKNLAKAEFMMALGFAIARSTNIDAHLHVQGMLA